MSFDEERLHIVLEMILPGDNAAYHAAKVSELLRMQRGDFATSLRLMRERRRIFDWWIRHSTNFFRKGRMVLISVATENGSCAVGPEGVSDHIKVDIMVQFVSAEIELRVVSA